MVPFRLLILIVPLVAIPCSARAQNGPRGRATPPVLLAAADWVLMVGETGGIAGVDHHATIDSTGATECEGFRNPCPDMVTAELLEQLNRQVREASPFRWSGTEAVGSDLLRRTVVLVIRVEGEPSTSEFVAFWDIAPPEGAEDAGRLHDLVRSVAYPSSVE
jgi:hypothetical protein